MSLFHLSYEKILDISLFFTLILTFSCCSLSMANTGDEVIYLHYFDCVNFYKKSVGKILIVHAICFKMIPIQLCTTYHLSADRQQSSELLKMICCWLLLIVFCLMVIAFFAYCCCSFLCLHCVVCYTGLPGRPAYG